MTEQNHERPNLANVLSGLKDFQRKTVDYVFRRLVIDPDPVSRFLIADEVGLGKTLVARGVIARYVDHLWEKVDRIDVVYICSNQDIAQQNINRLNITQNRTFQHASRATLLPIRIENLRKNKINFISLTPGTSFNLSSSTGMSWERVVLFYLLKQTWDVSEARLSNILRVDKYPENWKYDLDYFRRNEKIDPEIQEQFRKAVLQHPDLRTQFDVLAVEIDPRRRNLTEDMRAHRNYFVSQMRSLLAKSSLAALQPDLIILDEFQRFKYLLNPNYYFADLVNELFDYKDAKGNQPKILLLSATPYKMYTLQGEEGEDHYQDFIKTVEFLVNRDVEKTNALKKAITRYQRGYLKLSFEPDSRSEILTAKQQIEAILQKVMVRTERLAVSQDRNGMLKESCIGQDQLFPNDLTSFVYLDRIASSLGVQDQVEYWKSSAYPLNLMEGYKLKRKLKDAFTHARENGLLVLLDHAKPSLLSWERIQNYQEIDYGNARVRALVDQTLNTGNWQLLWLPPNLPYYWPEGPFADLPDPGKTKTLIFSSWKVVPKVIAVLLSYEAERRMLRNDGVDFPYGDLTKERKPLLRFAISKERKSGMSVFTLIYPSLTLAQEFDPLTLAKQSELTGLTSNFLMLERVKLKLRPMLHQASKLVTIDTTGPVDESWYWYAPLILDLLTHRSTVQNWLQSQQDSLRWDRMLKSNPDEDEDTGFADHIREFSSLLGPDIHLGKQPDDLLDVLAQIALAGPAVTSLRSIMRVTGNQTASPALMAAAAQAALGFRTLFNQPESIVMLQSLRKDPQYEKTPYWGKILSYCITGNLQAVMDEYVHILFESMGLVGHDLNGSALKLGEVLRQALSIRSPSLGVDDIVVDSINQVIKSENRKIRCRYALRFGNEKNETYEPGSAYTRDTDVRIAFNSPFRPFVLATTSIGQEGLDFHQYCHRVVHWNLPSNPVDLEQREGRIHRFKGHVIRRNLVENYGLNSIHLENGVMIDPWEQLFTLACQDRKPGENDLVPFWIYEKGRFKIERIIPMLPLSRESGRLEHLKEALVSYRSVIGQPRQQELLEVLHKLFPVEKIQEMTKDFAINLSPEDL